MAIIFLTSISIFIEGFDNIPKELLSAILTFDHIVTLIFIVELLVKVAHYGWKDYISSGWNKLDFTLVLFSLPSLYMAFTNHHEVSFEFLLVFRLCRVFKFFRFIRFIPGIEHLIKGVNNAMRSSVLVLLSFFILILVLSLLGCFLFKHISPEYFGNPLISLYSVFKIFTVEGWYEIPDSIADKTSPLVAIFTKLFFSAMLIIGGVLGLSLVNSIFVDSMVSDANNNMEGKLDDLHRKIDVLTEELRKMKEMQEK
ncbi:MAG: ion transporter [Cytophagaceae bacterium]